MQPTMQRIAPVAFAPALQKIQAAPLVVLLGGGSIAMLLAIADWRYLLLSYPDCGGLMK
jgi:hypothetical protein